MGNMSYCRFRNTLQDLKECEEYIYDELEDDDEEEQARKDLIELCKEIGKRVD